MTVKGKTKRKTPERRLKLNAGVLALATLTAFVLVGFAAAISPPLALAVSGVLLLSLAVMLEKRRRTFWETAMRFELHKMVDGNEKIAREVARNRNDISRLKEGMAETAKTIEKKEQEKPQGFTPDLSRVAAKLDALAGAPRSSSAPKIAAPDDFDLDTIPKAIKPQKKPSVKETINPDKAANDAAMEYYNSLSDTVVRELMRHAIATRDINVFVQPIMRLPQRKARFFEMFARIRVKPGVYVPAARYLELANKEALINEIDDLLLMHCLNTVKESAEKNDALAYFINISSATLKNTDFMKRLLRFISTDRSMAQRLVFEVQQKDFDDMQPALLEIVRGLGKLGCNFSLDHITHYEFDVALLQALRVRFVKFDASQILAKAREAKGGADVWRIKRTLEGNGIGFVAEKIENEYTLKELLDFDIHYGQGFLLGKPDIQAAYRKSIGTQADPKKRRA